MKFAIVAGAIVSGLLSFATVSGPVRSAGADEPSPTAPPSTQEPDLSGPRVIRKQFPNPLPNGVKSIQTGARTPSGDCSFHISLVLSPSEGKAEYRELAYDPDTCRVLVETAKTQSHETHPKPIGPTRAPNTAWSIASWDAKTGKTAEIEGENGPDSGDGIIAQDYDSPSAVPPPAFGPGSKISTGYMSARTEDPPNLDVNKIEQWLTWIWDGSNALEDSGSYNWEWLTLTGWSRYSHTDSHGNYGYQYTYQQTYTTFKNTLFCNPFADTWVYYSPMTIYGYKSGYLAGEVWRTKSGDCVDLLDFPDVTLQRTYDWYY